MIKKLLIASLLACALFPQAFGQDEIIAGTLVTPNGVIPHGWIVIKGGRIASILSERPASNRGIPTLDVQGIIFPGFIDLHNHPMYNVFRRWEPAGKFMNRYEWRDLQQYKDLIGTPGGELQRQDDQTFCDVDEYAEIRALIGGTTSITGISGRRGVTPPVPSCLKGLVRNLDWAPDFGGVSSNVGRVENALGVTPRDMKPVDADRIADELRNDKIDLLLVHVAEGAPLDLESTLEFTALKGLNLLGKHTAIIHGTALSVDDFQQMKNSGTALVWSPRSNIELYGITTNIEAAMSQGVTIALAPDWSPTGSSNMLSELGYAHRYIQEKFILGFSDKTLFEMATAVPARLANVADKIGTLEVGLYADLVALKGDVSQPYATIARAKPQDVQLVLVGGVALYGKTTFLQQLGLKTEAVDVCGTAMSLNSDTLSAGPFSSVQKRLTTDLGRYRLSAATLAECE